MNKNEAVLSAEQLLLVWQTTFMQMFQRGVLGGCFCNKFVGLITWTLWLTCPPYFISQTCKTPSFLFSLAQIQIGLLTVMSKHTRDLPCRVQNILFYSRWIKLRFERESSSKVEKNFPLVLKYLGPNVRLKNSSFYELRLFPLWINFEWPVFIRSTLSLTSSLPLSL